MGAAIRKLLSIAGPAIGPVPTSEDLGQIPDALGSMLAAKNGFVAFEGALLVLPASEVGPVPGINGWNASDGWRRRYSYCDSSIIFFAMDVFASQFGILRDMVYRLDVEAGDLNVHANSLEEWTGKMLRDYDYETGWSVAHDWQIRNRPLALNERLLPAQPFVLGGDYVVDNMRVVELREAMEWLGSLSEHVRVVPDGTVLTVKKWIR
jgi:hypothetical protein